jgi:hypothetical protein
MTSAPHRSAEAAHARRALLDASARHAVRPYSNKRSKLPHAWNAAQYRLLVSIAVIGGAAHAALWVWGLEWLRSYMNRR